MKFPLQKHLNCCKKLLKLIVYRKKQYLNGIKSLKMVRIRIDDSGSGRALALINDQDIEGQRNGTWLSSFDNKRHWRSSYIICFLSSNFKRSFGVVTHCFIRCLKSFEFVLNTTICSNGQRDTFWSSLPKRLCQSRSKIKVMLIAAYSEYLQTSQVDNRLLFENFVSLMWNNSLKSIKFG